MQTIGHDQAVRQWLDAGMDEIMDIDDYIDFLAKCHIIVYKEPDDEGD